MKVLKILFVFTTVVLFSLKALIAQEITLEELEGKEYNPIRTAVPFLMIAPDSRSAGMGDAGVATSPDEGSLYWNAAKFAFIENDLGMGLSYTPWLRQLVNDINLAYLNGHLRLDDNQVIAGGLRYFSLGDIQFTDESGNKIKTFNPNEFALTGSYIRKLGPAFAMSLSARYIHSNLTGSTDDDTQPGNAYAFDLGMFYTNEVEIGGRDATVNGGLNFSNIGSKVAYSQNTKNFLPMNLRLGGSFMYQLDQYNSLGVALDFNKLLVPTTTYSYNEDGDLVADDISDKGVPTAIVESFYDAPGVSGMTPFEEEISEINTSIGLEYWYDNKLAFRGGFFYEPKEKGNRKYFTMGAGIRLNVFGIDIAYLIPTSANNPLKNTIRFTLLFNFDAVATE